MRTRQKARLLDIFRRIPTIAARRGEAARGRQPLVGFSIAVAFVLRSKKLLLALGVGGVGTRQLQAAGAVKAVVLLRRARVRPLMDTTGALVPTFSHNKIACSIGTAFRSDKTHGLIASKPLRVGL